MECLSGAITAEAHRRGHNAVITCARLMTDHLRERQPIYWCCHQENVASAKTAERIGFQTRREYSFIVVRGKAAVQ